MPPNTAPKHVVTNGPGCRYAALNDQFYTGEVAPGVENDGFTPRENVNTYEEIVEESERSPTFSTFR